MATRLGSSFCSKMIFAHYSFAILSLKLRSTPCDEQHTNVVSSKGCKKHPFTNPPPPVGFSIDKFYIQIGFYKIFSVNDFDRGMPYISMVCFLPIFTYSAFSSTAFLCVVRWNVYICNKNRKRFFEDVIGFHILIIL